MLSSSGAVGSVTVHLSGGMEVKVEGDTRNMHASNTHYIYIYIYISLSLSIYIYIYTYSSAHVYAHEHERAYVCMHESCIHKT